MFLSKLMLNCDSSPEMRPSFPNLSPLVSVSYLGAQILESHEEVSQYRVSMYLLEVLWPPPLTSSPALPLSCLTGSCCSLGHLLVLAPRLLTASCCPASAPQRFSFLLLVVPEI